MEQSNTALQAPGTYKNGDDGEDERFQMTDGVYRVVTEFDNAVLLLKREDTSEERTLTERDFAQMLCAGTAVRVLQHSPSADRPATH